MLGSQSGEAYIEKLAENLNYEVLKSVEQVNEGILDGRYSVGVTTEAAAQTLRSGGADVDYIYPEEGTVAVLDGTAVRAGSSHKEEALAFLDFTLSRDAQKIMAVSRNRRSVRTDTARKRAWIRWKSCRFQRQDGLSFRKQNSRQICCGSRQTEGRAEHEAKNPFVPGPGFSGLLSGNTGSASVNQRGHGAAVYSFPEPPE